MILESNLSKQSALNGRLALLEQAGTAAVLELWDTPIGNPSGSPLATVILPRPCAEIAGSSLVFPAAPQVQAGRGGSIAWVRLKNGAGVVVLDGDAGLASDTSPAGLAKFAKLSALSVGAGGFVTFQGATLTQP